MWKLLLQSFTIMVGESLVMDRERELLTKALHQDLERMVHFQILFIESSTA